MIKKLLSIFLGVTTCFILIAALPVGTERDPVYTDSSGHVLSTPLIFSNQLIVTVAPTVSNHVARLVDITNVTASTFPIVPIAKGGTSTNTTMLPGAWTNRGPFTVNGNLAVVSNSLFNATNAFLGPSTFFGSTTTSNLTVSGTNNATVYSVGGVPGISCTITNIGAGGFPTNYFIFGSGILTNAF